MFGRASAADINLEGLFGVPHILGLKMPRPPMGATTTTTMTASDILDSMITPYTYVNLTVDKTDRTKTKRCGELSFGPDREGRLSHTASTSEASLLTLWDV